MKKSSLAWAAAWSAAVLTLVLTGCGGGGGSTTAGGSPGGSPSGAGGGGSTLPTAPDAPTMGWATASNVSATVTFYAPLYDGGSPVTSYTLTSNPGNLSVSGASSPLTVTGLTNGVSYTFTVTATNAAGTGFASGMSNAVTPATTPGAPAMGTATADNARATVNFSAPASDGGAQITGYSLTVSPGNFTVSAASSPAVVTGLANGTTYSFTASAINRVGTGPASASSNAVTPATLPGAPVNTSAWAANGAATVNFSAPASDGGAAITGYTVTSTPGNFSVTGASSPISVTGLANGTPYAFTVTAINRVGTSASSVATASVTPAAGTMYYVNMTGSDANAGTSGAAPFRTITHALAVAASSVPSTINVAPGYYGVTNGETIPVRMVNGVNLVGDTASKGMAGYYAGGWSGTIISGTGTTGNYLWPGTATYMSAAVAFPPNVTASLTGFQVQGGGDVCVVVDGATGANVVSNTLGVNNTNSVYVLTTSVATLTNNVMSGNAVANSTVGGILLTGTSRTTLRGNTVSNSNTGAVILVAGGGTTRSSPTVDLGTAASPGNNTILTTNGIQGVGLSVTGNANVVNASGNTWLPNVQGASAAGAYTVGTLVTGTVTLIGGNNYALTTSTGGLQF